MVGEVIFRPRVFLDIHIDTEPIGRIVVELFVDKAPKTCENFRALCTATAPQGRPELSYKLSVFHRVIDEFMIQGGDVTKGDGTGGISIYGDEFEDENLGWRDIDKDGLLCMANRGKDTNSSQFFFTLAPCPHLNAKHTVFGQVLSGQPALERMAKVRVDKNDRPLEDVIVAHCGELERRKKAPPVPPVNGRESHKQPIPDAEDGQDIDGGDDRRGRKRRRHQTSEDGQRSDHSVSSSSRSRSPPGYRQQYSKPDFTTQGHKQQRHHQRRHRRHDRSISHDTTLRGRTHVRSSSRTASPSDNDEAPVTQRNGRSRSPSRHLQRNFIPDEPRRSRPRKHSISNPPSRSPSPGYHHQQHHQRPLRRYRSRTRSRSYSRERRRYNRHRAPGRWHPDFRPDEDLIRREEEEREGGDDRFEGVIERDEDYYDEDRAGRRYGGGSYPHSDGRLGGQGHDDDDDGGGGPGVIFKGRGSMKYREKRW
ncbi:MAG: hypothetical protein M1837_006354 [Sclerophora amabilis]|nr:MAG: hypothetical protein M1837_006354 [Sclerophora amabilis]